jgi:hypothetical protein
MTRQDMERITDLLLEIGGDTPWVLLWDEPGADVAGPSLLCSAVEAREVPAIVCSHLLRMVRGELGPQDAVVWEN